MFFTERVCIFEKFLLNSIQTAGSLKDTKIETSVQFYKEVSMKAKEQWALQWHPAFFAGIQIELEEEKEYLAFVTSGYPHKVIRHLETVLHIQMESPENGIYYAEGAFFPIQFLVTSKLTDEMNFWLHHLTNRLKDSDEARKLLHRYEPYQDSNLHKSVMDIIVRANQEMFKGDEKMCDALMEIVQEKIEEKLEESVENISRMIESLQ